MSVSYLYTLINLFTVFLCLVVFVTEASINIMYYCLVLGEDIGLVWLLAPSERTHFHGPHTNE